MKARLAALAVLVVFTAAAWHYAAGIQQVAAVGAPAPDFTLETLDGEAVRLSDFRGRPVVLNFWATWCPPCIEEAPALEALHQRYRDRLVILGVDHLEAAPAVTAFRDRFHLTYPLLLDRNGAVGERYSVRMLPETWVIDAAGTARIHKVGAVTFEDVQALYREVAGHSIDGGGVGPVADGDQAFGVMWIDGGLLLAASGGLAAADPAAPAGLADPAAWNSQPGLSGPVHALAAAAGALWAAGADGIWIRPAGHDAAPGTWRPAGLQDQPVLGLALAPDAGDGLAWVPGGGLYRLDGDAWVPVPADLDPDLGSLALAADPREPGRWLAGFAAGLLESRDGGVSWRLIGPERAVFDLHFAGDILYLATDRGLWSSRDGGITAEPAGGPLRALVGVTSGEAGELWVLAPNGDLYRRDPDGSWAWAAPGAGGEPGGTGR